MAAKPDAAFLPPPPPAAPKPILISFALTKRAAQWHALALKTQGREVIAEKVLESDEYRLVASDTVDKVSHEYWTHGLDPFEDDTQ